MVESQFVVHDIPVVSLYLYDVQRPIWALLIGKLQNLYYIAMQGFNWLCKDSEIFFIFYRMLVNTLIQKLHKSHC